MISYSLYYFSFLSSIHFFFFFLLFFLCHTRIPTPISILSFFSLLLFLFPFIFLLDSRTSLSLSLFLSPTLFFFFSLLDHSLTVSVIRNGESDRERKNKREILLAPPLIEGHRSVENRRSLCQAAPSASPPLAFLPNAAQMG